MARDRQKLTQRAINKGHRNSRSSKKKFVPPRTAEEFFGMPEHIQDIYTRVTHAISKMRIDDVSLPQASQEYGVSPRQMQKFARKALRKLKNGRYATKAKDELLRVLIIPTLEGLREIAVIDSRQATVLAEYWNAAERYLSTGDASMLLEFRGKDIIDGNGKRVPLLTDLRELDRLGSAGVLSFESLYARVA